MVGNDDLVARRLRNYRAIHELNQNDSKKALAELDRIPPKTTIGLEGGDAGSLTIDSTIAKRLNADNKIGRSLGACGTVTLHSRRSI